MSGYFLHMALAAAGQLSTPELEELRVRIEQALADRKRCVPLPQGWAAADDTADRGGR